MTLLSYFMVITAIVEKAFVVHEQLDSSELVQLVTISFIDFIAFVVGDCPKLLEEVL